jgi:alkylated DNA repair protein alkB family protein 8
MIANYRSSSEQIWDTIAESFDLTRRKPWKQCLDFIDTFSRGDTVVDMGCGNGRHLLPSAQRCKKAVGMDISRELLSIVHRKVREKNLGNVSLLHADVVYSPLKDDVADKILYIASLHNIKGKDNRVRSLREVKRVLKKNREGLVSVWSRWQDEFRKQFLKQWFVRKGAREFGDTYIYWRQHNLNIPRFYHLYSKKEFIRELKEAGLKILDYQGVKIRSQKHPDNYFARVTK